MATSDLKTLRTKASVAQFIAGLKEPGQRRDSRALVALMRKITGEKPAMWGPSIVGFGSYHYVYASGREGDWPITGFSPRKGTMTVYIMMGLEQNEELRKRLGKHSIGKSCLYLKSLEGVDMKTLESLIRRSIRELDKTFSRSA